MTDQTDRIPDQPGMEHIEFEPDVASPNGIVMRGGDLNPILDAAESALIDAGYPIFQRGEELVRLSAINQAKDQKNGIRRAEGARILAPVSAMWLLQKMAESASWMKLTSKGLPYAADPDVKYAEHLLARSGEWPFPVLKGLLSAPTLDRDGRIVQRPGYDHGSQLYLDVCPGTFPAVPEQPTLDDARHALGKLNHLLRGFPFADEVSRSVALSAILTALIRPSIMTAPLHGFDAPAAGSGKSLFPEMVGIIATGNKPAAMNQGETAREDELRLSICLRASDPVIWIDNCERPLRGDFLCSMLTQEFVQTRILGYSARLYLPSSAVVLATGNNLKAAGDAARRIIMCRVDAGVERPDKREFDFDCREEAKATRSELVVAGLTALRAYRLSGAKEKLTPMGSFTEYDWVRATLVSCGYADPAGSRDTIVAADEARAELAEIMNFWEAAFGFEPKTLAQVNHVAPSEDMEKVGLLVEALTEATNRPKWNARAVGKYLGRHKGRILNGRRFIGSESGGRAVWRLERVGTPKQDDLPEI